MPQPTNFIRQTPTVTAGSYSVGDALGGRLEFTGAAQSGFGGVIAVISLVDKASQAGEIDIVFFDSAFTATADNAAFDPTDAELASSYLFTETIEATDYDTFADNSVATKSVTLPFRLPSGTTLYAQMVTRSASTYASTSDLTIAVGVIPD